MRTWIDFVLSDFIQPMALKAAEGLDYMSELKTRLDLIDILLTLSLESLLACLNSSSASLLWKGSTLARDLALFRDFLICDNSLDFGGLLGGGIWAGALNLEAWDRSRLMVDRKKASNELMEGVGVQLSSILPRMGVIEFWN